MKTNQPAPFRSSANGALLALVLATLAGEAGAVAGWVDFTSGSTNLVDSQGRQQRLTKGDNLDTGATVRTGADGRAQIRFTDGAYVSLQPNSEFSIKDYAFDGKADGNERSFFGLARGAMRTVTGLIGRVNKNRYQISTPTATIGIRGTGGLISIGPDGSTLVNGTSGIWTITNPVGTLDIPAGTAGRAPAAPNQPPQQTTEKPSTGPNQPPTTQLPYTQADNRTSGGDSTSIASNALKSGPGYTSVMAYFNPDPTVVGPPAIVQGGNAVFNGIGQMQSIALPGVPTAFTLPGGFSLIDGTHAEFGTDGIVAWGRWIGSIMIACDPSFPCTTIANYGPNQGLHYVVGMPTPVLPTTGTAVPYGLIGSTQPTYTDGSSGPGRFTLGSLTVTFAAGGATVAMQFGVAMPDGRSWNYSGSGVATSASFSTSGTVTSPTSCLSAGCSATVFNTFFGATAERLGTSYLITDVGANKKVVGAAAFQKQ